MVFSGEEAPQQQQPGEQPAPANAAAEDNPALAQVSVQLAAAQAQLFSAQDGTASEAVASHVVELTTAAFMAFTSVGAAAALH